MGYPLRRSERAWREGRGMRRGGYVTELKGSGKFYKLTDKILDDLGYQYDTRSTLADGKVGLYYHHVIKKGLGMMLPIKIHALLYYIEEPWHENHITIKYHGWYAGMDASSDSKKAQSQFKKAVSTFVKEWEKNIPEDPISEDVDEAFERAAKKAGMEADFDDASW